eukprot:5408773-Alexandrium_andersonii.AAC.1
MRSFPYDANLSTVSHDQLADLRRRVAKFEILDRFGAPRWYEDDGSDPNTAKQVVGFLREVGWFDTREALAVVSPCNSARIEKWSQLLQLAVCAALRFEVGRTSRT